MTLAGCKEADVDGKTLEVTCTDCLDEYGVLTNDAATPCTACTVEGCQSCDADAAVCEDYKCPVVSDVTDACCKHPASLSGYPVAYLIYNSPWNDLRRELPQMPQQRKPQRLYYV